MSIKLLTPISHLFNEETAISEIIKLSDEFEARERTRNLNIKLTTHYHIDFDLNIGLEEDQLDFLKGYVKPNEHIETLTFQAARDCEKVEVKNLQYFPKSNKLSLKEQVDNTKQSVKKIRDIVGTSRIIGLENNNFFNTGAYEICTSPEFLIESCEIAGINLLFDYAHAFVTCTNKNIDFQEYSKKLLNKIFCNQFHLCEPGFFYNNNTVHAIDSHNLPTPNSTKNALSLMQLFNVEYLTIEYYRDSRKLIEYLKYLKQLIKK